MVELGHAAKRFPRALSGGQQQRVALARCLIYQPSVILMDEPLGALDRKLREAMQMEIKRIHRESGATIIFVTHDQEEALELSDRICLMNEGKIAQIDTPENICQQPQTTFVAEFIGLSNILRGEIRHDTLVNQQGNFALPATSTLQGQAALVISPEHIRLCAAQDALIHGKISEGIYAGSETRLVVTLDHGERFIVRSSQALVGAIGNTVSLNWNPENARMLTM